MSKKLIKKLLKYALVCFLSVGIASALSLFFAASISKVSETTKRKRELSLILANRNQAIIYLKKNFDVIENANYEQKINEALPKIDDVLPFINALETLANKYSLTQNLKFGEPIAIASSADLPLTSVNYDLTINTTAPTLIDFLHDFEQLPYFAGATSITITSNNNGWGNNSAIFIKGKLYAKQ